jgi:hypothetical protein
MSDNQSYPGYTGNAASQRQHISLLPVVNQTAALARFFGSTVDPAFQAGDFAALNAYVGSRPSYYNAIQDFYLAEPDEARTNYQLEPAMIGLDTDGALRYALSYPDLLGYLQGQGATMGQDNRMFEGDIYAWAPPGQSGEGFYRAMRLARKSSSQAATFRRSRIESLLVAVRSRLWAMCLMVVKLAGACSVRTRHSSSRNIMSITQCRLFSMDQWLRTMGPIRAAAITRDVR